VNGEEMAKGGSMESSAKISMKKFVAVGLYVMLCLCCFQNASAATMGDYCQVPPFIGTSIGPNIMYVIDASASMHWQAYSKDTNGDKDKPYDSSKNYEGYFDPVMYYQNTGTASDPVYTQLTGTTTICTYNLPRICSSIDTGNNCFKDTATHGDSKKCTGTSKWNCATSKTCTTNDVHSTGNFLNYVYMARIDLARWSVTGGMPASCTGSSPGDDKCNPWEWDQVSGTGKVSDPSVGCDAAGCLLLSDYTPHSSPAQVDGFYFDPSLYDATFSSSTTKSNCRIGTTTGTYDATTYKKYPCYSATTINSLKIKAPWARVNDALVKQFEELPIVPRMGVMTFFGSGTAIQEKVYVGDFTGSGATSTYPFMNMITAMNRTALGSNTPTAPALWDAFAYFQQSTPNYGGFTPQANPGDSGNFWRNPLYTCPHGGGSNCIAIPCVRNFIILVSDGQWNTGGNTGTDVGCKIESTLPTRSIDPVVPAYNMHMGFLNGTTSTKVNAIYAVGLFMTGSPAEQSMKNIAMYGSFDTTANSFPDSFTRIPNSTDTCSWFTPSPNNSGCSTCSTAGCNNLSGSLCRAMPVSSPDWDKDGNNVPDTYLSAEDATDIKQKIMDAVLDILSRVTSGTAASVLASGEGSGANLVQATYYPKRKFFSASIDWTGGLQNLWYYIDPRFASSSIREDDGDRVLHLETDGSHHDYIAQLYFDTNDQKAKARIYSDINGDGSVITQVDTKEFEMLGNIWEAGKLLWNRSAADRLIYTPLNSSAVLTADANKFSASSPDNVATLRPLLNTDASSVASENNQLAANVINWVRGTDIADYVYSSGTASVSYRSRTVKIDLNGNNNASDTSVSVSGITMDETVAKVWKLGDIVDSTPRISSWVQLNGYDNIYGDATYKSFVSSATYTNRGMVFVGANDGMLHAFKLGTLELKWTGQDLELDKARLTGTDLGKEMWAFIPRNVLPYLTYLKDPDYCHIQSLDLTPYVFDASIEAPGIPATGNYWELTKTANSWRTILIGGMKLGGACRKQGVACNGGTSDCVNTPMLDPADTTKGLGYSAYFALDVTDQNNPRLLWEFTNENLGFTSSGPAIVRISSRTAGATNSTADGKTTDGRFFVVFGSGPTGPIDGPTQKFQGRSDQPLRLFVLDLKTGSTVTVINTGIANAFAGSILNANFDADLDYQDDVVYIPYVKKCLSTTTYCTANTWTDGGVLRLLTNEDLNGNDVSATGDTALNPGNWRYSKVIENIGPVTASVTRILNKNTGVLRLFFGTGRYFFRSESGTDDPDTLRNLFGIVEPCYDGSYKAVCLDSSTSNDLTRTLSELASVNLTTTAGSSNAAGWYIILDAPGVFTYDENGNGTITDDVARTYNAERVITDPLAASTGVVFFTTYKPYNDLCTIGGKTFIWAVKYDTGGAASSLLQGTALIQVSTGSIEQIKLSTAFTDKGQRRTSTMEGVPPMAQGLSIMTTPSPVKRVIHMRER
jgi:hypothetical protein